MSLYIKKKLFIYSAGKQISSGKSALLPTAVRRRRRRKRRRKRTWEEGRAVGDDEELLCVWLNGYLNIAENLRSWADTSRE